MESTSTLARIRWRSVPLILVGLIAGAFVLSPAVGEAAVFLTKKKADKRYLGNTIVASTQVIAPNNEGASIDVLCPSGRQATGGGYDSPFQNTGSSFIYLEESKPILSGSKAIGWNVEIGNATPNPVTATVYAVCAS